MSIKKAEEYISGVKSGEIIVGEYILLAVNRHLSDLDHMVEKGWYFDRKAAERVFAFFKIIRHAPDKRKWVPFDCEPWEAFIIYVLFGWKKADGNRRFTISYTEIAKKNGKTTFAAAIADYLAIADGENEAEVYCAASIEKQSMICFEKAKQMIEKTPVLRKHTELYRKSIFVPSSYSKVQPLGRDSNSVEGINPHGSIIDEFHVWKNIELLDNILSATVNRISPVTFIITTAGRDKNLPCYEFRQMCIDVLRGIKIQDDLCAFIYSIDEHDDWKDEINWAKPNPNIGVSVRLENLRNEFKRALNSPSQEFNFKVKNLNKWVDQSQTWIYDELVVACSQVPCQISDEDLRTYECHAGFDLASHVDLNALCLYWPDINGRRAAKFWFWIPEAKVEEKGDRVDYRVWRDLGLINVTKGNVIDIETLVSEVAEIINSYNVRSFDYDPAKAYHGVIQGLNNEIDAGIMHEYPQGIRYMSEPTKEIERIVSKGDLELFQNPVIRWMFRNAFVISDINENVKLDKKRSIEKIDGLVALCNAVGGCHFSYDKTISYDSTECISL